MADLLARKEVSSLPGSLSANTLYFVRTGAGFDLYLTDNTGTTAHRVNGPVLATLAQFSAATAGMALGTDSVWGPLAVLTDAATITIDLDAGYDFGGASSAPLALGGNRTLGAPSNVRNGKKGIIWFGASGATRTLTLNAAWKLATGVEAGPYSITTTETLGVAYVCRGTAAIVTGIVRHT